MNPPAPLPRFNSRVVPVVVIREVGQAVPLAEALLEGGIDVIEVTLRSEVALRAIEAIARAVPGIQVGAGTVTHGQRSDDGARSGLRSAQVLPGARTRRRRTVACLGGSVAGHPVLPDRRRVR